MSERIQGFRGFSQPPVDPRGCVPEKAGTGEPGAGPVRSEGGSGKQRVLGTLPGALGVVWGRVVEIGSPAGGIGAGPRALPGASLGRSLRVVGDLGEGRRGCVGVLGMGPGASRGPRGPGCRGGVWKAKGVKGGAGGLWEQA